MSKTSELKELRRGTLRAGREWSIPVVYGWEYWERPRPPVEALQAAARVWYARKTLGVVIQPVASPEEIPPFCANASWLSRFLVAAGKSGKWEIDAAGFEAYVAANVQHVRSAPESYQTTDREAERWMRRAVWEQVRRQVGMELSGRIVEAMAYDGASRAGLCPEWTRALAVGQVFPAGPERWASEVEAIQQTIANTMAAPGNVWLIWTMAFYLAEHLELTPVEAEAWLPMERVGWNLWADRARWHFHQPDYPMPDVLFEGSGLTVVGLP